eukprot:m.12403 g.12403  ORF g.12403 m.12403 type:complete len:727 (+) comp24027_c0_seq1:162-2342(+)
MKRRSILLLDGKKSQAKKPPTAAKVITLDHDYERQSASESPKPQAEGSASNPIIIRDVHDGMDGTLTPPREEEVVVTTKWKNQSRTHRTPDLLGEDEPDGAKKMLKEDIRSYVINNDQDPLHIARIFEQNVTQKSASPVFSCDSADIVVVEALKGNKQPPLMDRLSDCASRNGLHQLQEAVSMVGQPDSDYRSGLTPSLFKLARAIKAENLFQAICLLDVGTSPNALRDRGGGTPRSAMHEAARQGSLVLLHALLESNGDVDVLDSDGRTPLFHALENDHLGAVKLLTDNGANLFVKDSEAKSILHHAVTNSKVGTVRHLLNIYPSLDVNAQDAAGWTPLAWVSDQGINGEMVTCLLEHGANPNIKDQEGNTCLHWAAYSRSIDGLELFVKLCEINSRNIRGDTPLHLSCRNGDIDVIRFLLKHQANSSILNNSDERPIDVAPVGKRKLIHCEISSRCLSKDISKGQEPFAIPCVNDVDGTPPPSDFTYIMTCVESQGLQIDRSMETLKGCDCGESCIDARNCKCAQNSERRRFWFDKDGKINLEIKKYKNPLVYECNPKCSCTSQCKNRVVQKGSKCKLELFRTMMKGWGVRARQNIPKGSLICEYAGRLITDEAANRIEDDTYLFDLDVDGQVEGCMCIDACKYGNVSRFINHSCEPNVFPIQVFSEHHDKKFPKMVFFSMKDVAVNEEICFDYGDRFWNVKHKEFPCSCGTRSCRFVGKKRRI